MRRREESFPVKPPVLTHRIDYIMDALMRTDGDVHLSNLIFHNICQRKSGLSISTNCTTMHSFSQRGLSEELQSLMVYQRSELTNVNN